MIEYFHLIQFNRISGQFGRDRKTSLHLGEFKRKP